MSGPYVVSRSGMFGVVQRWYYDGHDRLAVVIRWGPLGWLTPVLDADVKHLASRWEREAREEADVWIKSLPRSTP